METEITNKWGKSIEAGFQQVPDVLIRAQSKLGIDSLSLVILLNLTMHWWEKDNLPWPRPSVIAKRIGVSTRTVERKISELTDKGLIERLPPEKTDRVTIRRFNLSGLIKHLEPLAEGYREDYLSMRQRKNNLATPAESEST
ncbi:helix-turn-helix domain-containing protein [Methylomonas methanica]|uniref:helix-turn-helix domain-containing protein n=1 Tax=Methylomonas methanica TaxID=421 RepID=UPI0012F665B4|nr:helix-turn-helix domain-containing protein [Methylomonas methanica]